MSVNKKMHPRNIFRTPPPFAELARIYPEFKPHMKVGLDGKLQFKFNDVDALRALTKTLMQHYFGILLEIPTNTLVPTVPLRLNYILWLQDLAQSMEVPDTEVSVVDIGAGATCIYGLLIHTLRKWKVLALESNESNFNTAVLNVQLNKMEDSVNVKNTEKSILTDAVDMDYTFCMCNPPFFNENDETSVVKAKLPRNAFTGTSNELTCPGGEVAFVKQIIKESLKLRQKIRVYTTMIGLKKSIKPITDEFKSHGIRNWTHTEFYQGNTTRWALGWSFDDSIDLTSTSSDKKPNLQTFSHTVDGGFENSFKQIQEVLKELKMNYSILYKNEILAELKIQAFENTWSHARRKRRAKLRQEKMIDTAQIIISRLKTFTQTDHSNTKYHELTNEITRISNDVTNFKQISEIEDEGIKIAFISAKTEFLKKVAQLQNDDEGEIGPKRIKLDESLTTSLQNRSLESCQSPEVLTSASMLLEFVIFIRKVSDGVKISFFRNRTCSKDCNYLCEIYNYFVNKIKIGS